MEENSSRSKLVLPSDLRESDTESSQSILSNTSSTRSSSSGLSSGHYHRHHHKRAHQSPQLTQSPYQIRFVPSNPGLIYYRLTSDSQKYKITHQGKEDFKQFCKHMGFHNVIV